MLRLRFLNTKTQPPGPNIQGLLRPLCSLFPELIELLLIIVPGIWIPMILEFTHQLVGRQCVAKSIGITSVSVHDDFRPEVGATPK